MAGINYTDYRCMVPSKHNPIYLDYDSASRTIVNVIFHEPATIVFWSDGTKTVVKAHDEPFDKEKGLAMAIAKKFYGNNYIFHKEIKKWVD